MFDEDNVKFKGEESAQAKGEKSTEDKIIQLVKALFFSAVPASIF